ncbi:hypothetical protein EV200_107266 [Pedobacter psychrotolerans]|uniref:Uncharacterized protein n=1 Tax=Pedobacter psychrotolerans TaxID=1843235 RepID=A0A4R2H6E0_9SPHI|nr:DUF2683 family protein [Pedobacter psychrotolerans]TCO21669.1 hypothetical protein EV200_107266 [Pedobacter psychrotolerans]GGE40260.1 hypothetical protein GCM10011413_02540 [Pedobacter psychrotolerans]
MEALIIQPRDKKQLSAIKAILKALDVTFKKVEQDETSYLSQSIANKRALDESIKQAENGQTVKIAVADLWK